MKKWQIENSETSEISEILFRVFLFPSFRFCPIAKIEFSEISEFSTWPFVSKNLLVTTEDLLLG